MREENTERKTERVKEGSRNGRGSWKKQSLDLPVDAEPKRPRRMDECWMDGSSKETMEAMLIRCLRASGFPP